jgi:hypothetical protein
MPFNIPPHWREWLGSIRADEVQNSNLFLLSKLHSLTPDILDGENQKLKQRVWHFYVGLLLASTVAPAHKPVMLTGSRRDGEVEIRQQQDLDCSIPSLVGGCPSVLAKDIRLAAPLRRRRRCRHGLSLSGNSAAANINGSTSTASARTRWAP